MMAAVRSTRLQARYEVLAAAVEAADDGVRVLDRAGGALYESAALHVLLGTPAEAGALEGAMADARRAAATRRELARQTAAPAEKRPRPLTFQLRTQVMEYRVQATSMSEAADASFHDLVVIWVRRCRPRLLTPDELRHRYSLTRREARVAALISGGCGSREVASALEISPHTARRHAESVLRKLRVHSRHDVREKLRA
jgi:DNA-binding CsgD family transcriptional regulator